ncbi:hypothetical protein BCCGELA001_31295 [Bradyrhizobium sp. CCGE-LA001]|nr:hypothetical protein BCCGELA001_31295 [Bradyrhizobium sp. CCGE-LA001]
MDRQLMSCERPLAVDSSSICHHVVRTFSLSLSLSLSLSRARARLVATGLEPRVNQTRKLSGKISFWLSHLETIRSLKYGVFDEVKFMGLARYG